MPTRPRSPRARRSDFRTVERLHAFVSLALARVFHRCNRWLRTTALGARLHRRLRDQLVFSSPVIAVDHAPALAGLEIAFLSDLHIGAFLDASDLDQLLAEVAQQQPDIVCFGGDLVSYSLDEVEQLSRGLARLSPPLGVYAVPGNHEYQAQPNIGPWCDFLAARGVDVLINRGRRRRHRDASIWVAGLDDRLGGKPDLDAALSGRRDGEPVLLFSHNPDEFADAAAAGVELTLSGHTHGGQIRLFGWTPITHSQYGYQEGLYRDGASCLYVGRGVGVTDLPLRIGADPELPQLKLELVATAAPAATAAIPGELVSIAADE